MKHVLQKQWRRIAAIGITLAAVGLAGCATSTPYDYSALQEADPSSILVLPPLNNTPDVDASNAVYAGVTLPLAESGYYVFPVGLTHTLLQENGIANPAEAHQIPLDRLQKIFGADAVLYMQVQRYGTVYSVINSESVVALHATLKDARTGQQLWAGEASASSNEGNAGGSGLVGILVTALVNQVVDTLSDRSYQIAHTANQRLLLADSPAHGALLHGPRSPKHGQPPR